jgi:tRNA threonylcarbamoyladenosine biosynthesis protein TsaE
MERMNIAETFETISGDLEETKALAQRLGKLLKGGEVIELLGDVGSGKTSFVKGLAVGLGSEDHVTSPTFTVHKVYGSGRLPIYHYDFYRLHDHRIIQNELAEAVTNGQAVIVLEWAENIQQILPKDHIKIEIEVVSENERKFTFRLPPKNRYLRGAL